jgi:hypothetical protein
MRFSCVTAGLAAGIGALLAAANAEAATCNFTGTTIYATGASSGTPYIQYLSQVMANLTPPVTLVYLQTASCAGVTDLTTSTVIPSNAFYWSPPATAGGQPVENTCTPEAPGVFADASVSDVYASTCGGASLAAGQKEFSGPVQAMTFVVNPSSSATAISEQAAHVVLNDIGVTNFTVAPWTVPSALFIRSNNASTGSGVFFMIANALGLSDNWSADIPAANMEANANALVSAVSADSAQADATLGILSVTGSDPNRPGSASTTPVKELAFQALGQSCGYLPDSSSSAFDKLNVREGRYLIWGPIHFITAVSGGVPVSTSNPGDAPTNAAVAKLIDLVTLDPSLTEPVAEQSIAAAASADVIPDCAMRVQRVGEVTPAPVEYSYLPPEGSCGCYWESQTGTTACTACTTTSSTCPVCRYGYCEAF